jgi:hypothetical protein
MKGFLLAISELPSDLHEAIEILAVLRMLAALGLDAGEIPGEASAFTPALLAAVLEDRAKYVARINTGITASGL